MPIRSRPATVGSRGRSEAGPTVEKAARHLSSACAGVSAPGGGQWHVPRRGEKGDTVPAARRRIGFLLFDGVKALDVIGPAEVFAEANLTADTYDLVFLSASGADVMTSMGLAFGVHAAASDSGPLDTIVVPGSEWAPDVFDDAELRAAIFLLSRRARRVASICSGAFGLAAVGLLDGGPATTHWKFADELARRHPAVRVDAEHLFTRQGEVFTSAGVAAGIDLALCLVEDDLGADVARTVAQGLLVYMRRAGGQAQFSAPLRARTPRTSLGAAIAAYVAENPTRPLTVGELAAHVNVSTRHVTRVIRDELGATAASYVAAVRLSIAVGLLESGAAVTEAAASAGFPSVVALRRAFAAQYRMTPSEYQRRFRRTASV